MKKKIRKFAEGGLNIKDLKALNLRDQAALNPNALKALNVRHGYEMQNVPKITTEILPMNYVPNNRGRGGPSLAQRTETARVSGGYDTLVPQTEKYWVNSRSRGGRGGGYATRQTGWIGTKKTPNYELVNVGPQSLNVNELKALQLKKGGKVTTKNKTKKVVKCTRGDGCAKRGKTKGRMV